MSKLSPTSTLLTFKTAHVRIDERDDEQAIQDYLMEKSGQRTVPNVFISAHYLLLVFPSVLTSGVYL